VAEFKLSIVTPTGSVLDADVSEATVPGVAGEFGVFSEHQPALMMLGGGLLSYHGSEETGTILIRGGVAEVGPNSLLILTDHAITPESADRAEAEALLEQLSAEEAIVDALLDDARVRRHSTTRSYAEAVIKVAGH
jgi:F-type H+-transporting ATPase subunit epsilon